MFERYLVDVLTTHFGNYIENLDTEKIRLSTWRGELVLKDLSLRTDALNNILNKQKAPTSVDGNNSSNTTTAAASESPVELVYGKIGNLELRIPWSTIRSQLTWTGSIKKRTAASSSSSSSQSSSLTNAASQCSIVLSDVNILITPRRSRRGKEQQTDDEEEGDEDEKFENDNNTTCKEEEESTPTTTSTTLEEHRIKKEKEVQKLLDSTLLKRIAAETGELLEFDDVNHEEDEEMTSAKQQVVLRKQRKWQFWMKRIVSNLLSTVNITVKNVHIRYEDPGSCIGFVWNAADHGDENDYHNVSQDIFSTPISSTTTPTWPTMTPHRHHHYLQQQQQQQRQPFAIGITLRQFSVQTTDGSTPEEDNKEEENVYKKEKRKEDDADEKEGDEGVIAVDAGTTTTTSQQQQPLNYKMHHKLAAAYQLSIYWDSDCQLISESVQLRQRSRRRSPSISDSYMNDATDTISIATPTPTTPTQKGSGVNINTEASSLSDNYDNDDKKYIASEFDSLLNDINHDYAASYVHKNLHDRKHTYILDPVSPSLHFSVLQQQEVVGEDTAKENSDDVTMNDKNGQLQQQQEEPPPSTLVVTIPPCHLAIARNTLEDTAYMRKSFSIWNQSRKGLQMVPESTIRRLTKLRPSVSPLNDPAGWWKYAYEATLVINKVVATNKNQDEASKVQQRQVQEQKRRRGWLGLAQALGQKKKYIALYLSFLSATDTSMKETMHTNLIEMEDELLLQEIVAFRILVYSAMITASSSDTNEKILSSSSSVSFDSILKSINSPEENFAVVKQEVIEGSPGVPISYEHRRNMFIEMAQALQKETILKEEHVHRQIEKRKSHRMLVAPESPTNIRKQPGEKSNPIVWRTSVVCPELALQINEDISESTIHNSIRRPMYHQRVGSSRQQRPIVRLSCAATQSQYIYQDGSWKIESSLASLEVKELSSSAGNKGTYSSFTNLVGQKSDEEIMPSIDGHLDTVVINGISHRKCASIIVSRAFQMDVSTDASTKDSTMHVSGSITRTQIRLAPLEIVYATDPVEALTRVFSTVKTPELAGDYHRMASVISNWRKRQRQRLLNALAHRRKKIIVDVDIAAPVILVPEDFYQRDCPMLVVDLGRLTFKNAGLEAAGTMTDFHDKWQLELNNMQALSSSTANYRREMKGMERSSGAGRTSKTTPHKLVEPFSLEFIICTKVTDESANGASGEARVRVNATLPRLVFNFTSSAAHLVSRLRHQWEHRKAQASQLQSSTIQRTPAGKPYSPRQTTRNQQLPPSPPSRSHMDKGESHLEKERTIEFHFEAPLIALKLENDIVGREVDNDEGSAVLHQQEPTPLIDLALRGISGTFSQEVSNDEGITSTFETKLRSLDVVDLYQQVGDDFSLLLSSASPETLLGSRSDLDSLPENKTDLVAVHFESHVHPNGKISDPDKLSITFHELFVEWNPESIAAIQKALSTPKQNKKALEAVSPTNNRTSLLHPLSNYREQSKNSEDEEFFDALQDDMDENSFHESNHLPEVSSSQSFQGSEIHLLSEIASSQSTSTTDLEAFARAPQNASMNALPGTFPMWSPRLNLSLRNGIEEAVRKSISLVGEEPLDAKEHETSAVTDRISDSQTNSKPSQITFDLSKLRVRFNKDSRRRRLFTAQMDRTHVNYFKKAKAGSETSARIGNLRFFDPSSKTGNTLYSEILGLKMTDSPETTVPTSLVEMTLSTNPRIRRFASTSPEPQPCDSGKQKIQERENGVTINTADGKIDGFDNHMTLHFSPMRFVYLQQLWFEIADYFFEGIVGFEVWGKERPNLSVRDALLRKSIHQLIPVLDSNDELPGADAKGVGFTRFNITMDAPVFVVPVTYRSPQHIRLEFKKFEVSNRFSGQIEKTELPTGEGEALEVGPERMQWYNNCSVAIEEMSINSWAGAKLNRRAKNNENAANNDTEDKTIDAVNACINIKWPVGPTNQLVIPKWKVDCSIDNMDIFLYREDYALLQSIVNKNIGEPSRHLEEWNALQNLPASELEQYKKRVIVHFGYDKKDAAPATFDVAICLPSITFFLLRDGVKAEGGRNEIARALCTDLEWRYRKSSDRIGRQRVTCDVSLAVPSKNNTTAFTDLLVPLHFDQSQMSNQDKYFASNKIPELTYTSTTHPSGDNVKTLEIADACIYFVYPAFVRVRSFFQNLPLPDIKTPEEVGLCVQVGDRWYLIGESQGNSTRRDQLDNSSETSNLRKVEASNAPRQQPAYQFRLVLTSPHIVLDSSLAQSNQAKEEHARVILSTSHIDYLHTNDSLTGKITRAFFVHDLELYTSSHQSIHKNKLETENSLIHPWCFSGLMERCNYQKGGNCDRHSFNICADVLRARAAYSDMSIAIDICFSILSDYREANSLSTLAPDVKESSPTDHKQNDSKEPVVCEKPLKKSFEVVCDGIQLLVVDDSLRHFASAQELTILSLGLIKFANMTHNNEDGFSTVREQSDGTAFSGISGPASLMMLRLNSLDIFDCLQPVNSSFRLAATSRATEMKPDTDISSVLDKDKSNHEYSKHRRMSWPDFSTSKLQNGRFAVSEALTERVASDGEESSPRGDVDPSMAPAPCTSGMRDLIEVRSSIDSGGCKNYDATLHSLAVQWNPSTVIALQRFLGRLNKEAHAISNRFSKKFQYSSDSTSTNTTTVLVFSGNSSSKKPPKICAKCRVEAITVCLNKEHQNRRLLRYTLSGSQVVFQQDEDGISIDASIDDLNAWDTDHYNQIADSNRRVLKVISHGESAKYRDGKSLPPHNQFVKVHYKTFAKGSVDATAISMLPDWVRGHISTKDTDKDHVDDYLSVSVAMVEFTYIRERTEELLDYLSNGLPGKGMGYTSSAAQGFIKKRLKTQSFLDFRVYGPQVKVPQHEVTESGILIRLGDLSLNSWFEEETLENTAARACNDGETLEVESSPGPDSNLTEGHTKEWWRILSLSLVGIGCSMYGDPHSHAFIASVKDKPLDLHLTLRKPTWHGQTLKVDGFMSHIDVNLRYSEYVRMRAVLRDNIGRSIDMSSWDNIEKAYWMEEARLEAPDENALKDVEGAQKEAPSPRSSMAYASERVIRYGTKARQKKAAIILKDISEDSTENEGDFGSRSSPSQNTVEFKFDLNGLSLTLHRDDLLDEGDDTLPMEPEMIKIFNYDMVLFQVQKAEISASSNAEKDKSFNLALYNIGLFDLGDVGRLARERYHRSLHRPDENAQSNMRNPCAFSVLAEGYPPPEETDPESSSRDSIDPQLIVSVNQLPSSSVGRIGSFFEEGDAPSKVTVASVVINYLTVNALIRPIRELLAFASCSWPSPNCVKYTPKQAIAGVRKSSSTSTLQPRSMAIAKAPTKSSLQLKLTAHYPRVFFVADESDPHSRALVLRGLLVVNLSIDEEVTFLGTELSRDQVAATNESSTVRERRGGTTVNANIHSVETYINPDVDVALGLKPHHIELLRQKQGCNESEDYGLRYKIPIEEDGLLGVALIEPVTIAIEYSQIRRDLFPTFRAVYINMEPVSTTLSFEDLSLIETVTARWSSDRGLAKSATNSAETNIDAIEPPGKGTAKVEEDIQVENEVNGVLSQRKTNDAHTYVVTFTSPRLGLLLKRFEGEIVVESIQDQSIQPTINVGDALLEINGDEVEKSSLDNFVRQLGNTPRPTTVKFCHRSSPQPHESKSDTVGPEHPSIEENSVAQEVKMPEIAGDFSLAYALEFHCGMPTGIKITQGACWNVPVVSDVITPLFASAVNDGNENDKLIRIPRPGTVIVSIDEEESGILGYAEMSSILQRCMNKADGSIGPEASPLRGGSESTGLGENKKYTIKFLELDSSSWGNVDKVDVSVAGVALTFIDDFKGRDMPLLRGNLNHIDVHVEQGLGMETRVIEVPLPTILDSSRLPSVRMKETRIKPSAQDLTEKVIKFCASARTGLDYYHSRNTVWQPMVEFCQLSTLLEWQRGNDFSPGLFAVEFSDQNFNEGSVNIAGVSSTELIRINFTDSAAEIAMLAVAQWKEWRSRNDNKSSTESLRRDSLKRSSSLDDLNKASKSLASTNQDWIKGADVSIQDASLKEKYSTPTNRQRSPSIDDFVELPFGSQWAGNQQHSIQSDKIQLIQAHTGVVDETKPLTSGSAKRAARRNAAHAALVFAQKRGAGVRKQGDTAKPFVFRNRTGMSLSFAPHKKNPPANIQNGKSYPLPEEETNGFEGIDVSTLTTLSDGHDACFHLDVLVDDVQAEATSNAKVRAYDGQELPALTVILESVTGAYLEPIIDLPVFKVGTVIRRLCIRQETGESNPFGESDLSASFEEQTKYDYSIPVVWTVEIEDNRRILTLSGAVRIMSMGLNTTIEIGVRRLLTASGEIELFTVDDDDTIGEMCVGSESTIVPIGSAKPGSPFYIPLWLALKFERVGVYIRPETRESLFSWGEKGVLEFVPIAKTEFKDGFSRDLEIASSQQNDSITWRWREMFSPVGSVCCAANCPKSNSAWLSCYASTEILEDANAESTLSTESKQANKMRKRSEENLKMSDKTGKVLTVAVDSGITIRNLLPLPIEWEISTTDSQDGSFGVVDGSTIRKQQFDDRGVVPLPYGMPPESIESEFVLNSGDCAEVFSTEFSRTNLQARFRCTSDHEWSQWANISFDQSSKTCSKETNHDNPVSSTPIEDQIGCRTGYVIHHRPRQVNVQMKDEFGVPMTVGLRLLPKIAKASQVSGLGFYFGVNVILHAELWLRNLTNLPLTFGCPSSQLHVRHEGELGEWNETIGEAANKIAAEAALMELISVLEFGEKGKAMRSSKDNDIVNTAGDMHALQFQEHVDVIYEEVFEYVQITDSTVRRRWWASEKHDICMKKPLDYPSSGGSHWSWLDPVWKIDCSGASHLSGGWESCCNLVGGKENEFSGRRIFISNHSFRRRRWFRRKTCMKHDFDETLKRYGMIGRINAFHQPVVDTFSRLQREADRKATKNSDEIEKEHEMAGYVDKRLTRISMKCGDGRWSEPVVVPDRGQAHGVLRVLASRWPTVTKTAGTKLLDISHPNAYPETQEDVLQPEYESGSLSPEVFELCYHVSDIHGDWGEFSRLLLVTERFTLRNDSQSLNMEVKQTGAPDHTALNLKPGQVAPFYWADMRYPELVSIRPVVTLPNGTRYYRWSGGFDICNLGMLAVRIRKNLNTSVSKSGQSGDQPDQFLFQLRSVRAHVEIRPRTGGTGINVSFREEDFRGEGSLFRIENLTPFPLWLAQDGVLANPSASFDLHRSAQDSEHAAEESEAEGDLVRPMSQTSFSLDVPFRQGKYAHRKAVPIAELLRVRVGLASLGTREGIESTKVICLAEVGDFVRLNPTYLTRTLKSELIQELYNIRVLGIVTTDGPTRVLRFCLMWKDLSVFGAATFAETAAYGSDLFRQGTFEDASLSRYPPAVERSGYAWKATNDAATTTINLILSSKILSEEEAKRQAFFGTGIGNLKALTKDDISAQPLTNSPELDHIFSFRASFSGFVFSLVDSSPSEIAVVSLRNINMLAKWNALRTIDANALVSIGWLQVDNHVPNVPFPVAVCADDGTRLPAPGSNGETLQTSGDNKAGHIEQPPLLMVGLVFAPKHDSGILCLKSATVSPRNLAIGIDLASLVRLYRFVVGIREHFSRARQVEDVSNETPTVSSVLNGVKKRPTPMPDIESAVKWVEGAGVIGVGRQKFYFAGFTILPCNINLSVAPSRSLTAAQAALEGRATAAIHAAVRKGDVLVGGSDVLGVTVGNQNRTASAVAHGVFKSIVVDALLRLDGASLDFSGVYLRNHISTGPQLTTFLVAHYMQSLRSNIPALVGSLAAIGNPLGLIRGLGDGVSDFVTEPVKGFKRSVEELDPSFVVGGVARGTESLARHAVGGIADSASLLTETFSKNMAVLTLDRRYAQRRDRRKALGSGEFSATFVDGVESGVAKLVRGVVEGVTGVVRAPIRGAEKKGVEGFAKGIGKGLLGLLVKPVIGISDAVGDVMIGVKGSVEGTGGSLQRGAIYRAQQLRPRRPMYGKDRILRPYQLADAAASALMMRTRLAGELYLSHYDMGDKVALLSVERILVLSGVDGKELLMVSFDRIAAVEVQCIAKPPLIDENNDGEIKSNQHGIVGHDQQWSLIMNFKVPRQNGSVVEAITCKEEYQAKELVSQVQYGMKLASNET